MVRCIPSYYVILKMIASSLCWNHFPLPLSAKVITLANDPIIRDELIQTMVTKTASCVLEYKLYFELKIYKYI